MPDTRYALVTGANGLLGRQVLEALARNYRIHALVHNRPQDPLPDIFYLPLDFTHPWSIDDLPDGIDTVIHLAQSDKFRYFPDTALDIFDVNIRSTAILLDYAYKKKIKNFIYASSGGVYGTEGGTFNENAPIDARYDLGYYLGSKLCSEIFCQNYSKHMDVSILRFFFLYGRRQKRTMLLPRLVDNIRQGNPITLQGENGISINPIHVNDAAQCLLNILNSGGSHTINIAGNNTYSLKKICGIIGELVGRDPIYEYISTAPRNLLADISLMKNNYFEPTISLEEGLKDLL